MFKKIVIILSTLVLVSIIGCSSSGDADLSKVNDEVRKLISLSEIPKIDDLDIKEIVVKNGLETDKLQRNTVIITYTDKKGELEKQEAYDKSIKLLYGPYEGDKVFTLSVSEIEAEFSHNMETIMINGLELLHTQLNDNLLIYTRHNGLSYTTEARITNKYTKDKQFEFFSQAVTYN
ncbi:hypothetical protein J41TS12_32560 [Paenibacillus antibioticophila]|uniref:Lipoprotein n=1 Tax=Paenibacillus antibioticophila TaxID=1274374 RepID=A0A920CG66_9BACL|nr:hypothetical protein [Paenibacillus antibioticophila]GIO38395.1 hypothetical protein J41TS12_32560 [Paenibacillus antibioticophila]